MQFYFEPFCLISCTVWSRQDSILSAHYQITRAFASTVRAKMWYSKHCFRKLLNLNMYICTFVTEFPRVLKVRSFQILPKDCDGAYKFNSCATWLHRYQLASSPGCWWHRPKTFGVERSRRSLSVWSGWGYQPYISTNNLSATLFGGKFIELA